MKKRLISLLLAFSMMLTFLPAGAVSAFAKENTLTYDCGETQHTVTATLSPNNDGDETYTLTITGDGPMANYDGSSDDSRAPWYEKIQNITRLIVGEGVTTLGDDILYYSYYDNGSDFHSFHPNLREVKLPEGLSYIGARAFCDSPKLNEVKIPNTVTKIKEYAFSGCTGLTEIELPPQLEEVDGGLFSRCSELKEITIPSSVKTIGARAFQYCTKLESVTLSEGLREIEYQAFYCTNLKSLNIPKSVERLEYDMVGGCQHLAYITIEPPSQLKETEPDYFFGGVFGDGNADVYCEPGLRNLVDKTLERADFITTVDVTLVDGDTITPKKIDYGADITALDKDKPIKPGYTFTGWYTDADCKIRYPDAQLFTNIKGTTLYAGWKFDPDALDCHQLTVTGGTVTVKYDGSDVTNTLTVTPDEATGKKTYDVPDGAEVTVTLDKTQTPEGMVFDSWSTGNLSLPTSQDYKAESIPFTMNSDVDIAAQYRDAATDHTPDTAVCHQLTVTGGTATVEKDGQPLVIDPVVTGDKKTYSVPDGATVTVTLDKTPIPEDMVFDSWSTGKFSLPLGQDYKAETITFTMNTMSSDADIAAQYRDASIEDDGPGVLGTAAIIGTAAVGTAVLGYQAYSLGAEFAGKLMALPYFPSNRSALAMMLWEDAGKPMPESELLYPDVEQEEQDMDLQHAARWAMENELIPDLNDEGTAPEEMKFYPDNTVSKIDVLNAWQKAQELKQNA